MRMVRGRTDARWLPSRHHFALFRLGAYLRLRGGGTPPDQPAGTPAFLVIDRHQSVFENYGIAIWVVLTITCYFSVGVFGRWPVALALLASLALAAIAMQIPLVVIGVLLPGRNNIKLSSMISMLLLMVAALYYATADSWVRFAAWQFLGFVALNAAAAVIVFFLRGSIAKREAAFGG